MTDALAIRPARKSDASDIALLVNIAAHGGPAAGWAADEDAAGTYDPIEVGRLQALGEASPFTWRNASMAESGDEIVGMLLGYREPDEGRALPPEAPPYFVPLYELEAAAAGDWYINMLATYRRWRGQGIGSKLLELAAQKQIETQARGLALIVEDVNAGARRLYERHGFRIGARRKIVPFPAGSPKGEEWLLMVKE